MKGKPLYGIVGKNIGHSFSPGYFNAKFLREHINAAFELIDLPRIEELTGYIRSHPELMGFSVTIPYKQAIIKLLDGLSAEARKIGAVNCVKVTPEGLTGYNTDITGFGESLKPLLKGKNNLNALILGTGGASKAVAFVLKKLSVPFKFVSRNPDSNQLNYDELDKELIISCPLIVNTTPAGMYPFVDTAPNIPYRYLTKNHILYDLIYNPEETLFLKRGREAGAVVKNGLEMLHIQAEAAWKIWQG